MPKFSNEFILPHILTPIQHQILIGGLLGDIGMSKQGKYPRIKIERQFLDKPYLEYQYNIFKDLCLSGIKEVNRFDARYDKWHKYVYFRTRAVPAFLDYHNKWYPNNIKQLPEDLELTSLIVATWFSDDGCIIKENNSLTIKFSTECFHKQEVELLSSKLQDRYKEKFPIYRKKKEQFIIKASTVPAQAILKDIQLHIQEMSMIRKYDIWKDMDLNVAPLLGRPK